jgi:prepilin-type processing-associated H-X9-DG protein
VIINSTATITPTSGLPGSTVNVAGYSQTISASGGTGAITLSLSAGTLPPGLSLSTPSSTFVNGGGLNDANDIAFDTAGNLYVANYGAGNILKVTPGGVVSTFASGFTTSTVRGMVIDAAGNLYVGSLASLIKVSPTGTWSTLATPGPSTIYGLALDTAGNIYVPGYTSNTTTIFKVTPTGAVSTFITNSLLNEPVAMIFDTAGNAYVTNYASGTTGAGTVVKVTPTGTVTTLASGFSTPKGLTIDAAGNLYIANETGSSAVSRVTPTGAVSTFVSGSGLSAPIGVAFDSSGNLYVLNNSTNTITKVTPNVVLLSGTPTAAGTFNFTITAADGTGSTSGQPYSITMSPAPLAIATAGLPNSTVSQPYSQTIVATAGAAPYTFAVTAGSPPASLTLSSAGVLSGTSSTTGTFTFTVTAADSTTPTPMTASQAYTVSINPAATITPASLPSSIVNVAGYSQSIAASGGTGAIALSLSSGSLPPGLSLSTPAVVTSTFVNGGGLSGANDIAFDTGGNLYVANYSAGNILKVTPGGASSIFASGFATSTVRGMAIDAVGNLYVGSLSSLIKVSPTGTWSTFATPGPSTIYGLAIDNAGNIYVPSYTTANTILRVTPAGAVSTFVNTNSLLNQPVAMVFDTAGNSYVTNYASGTSGAGTLVKVTPSGTVTLLASGFSAPKGLTIDTAGNLYVANETLNTVSKVTSAGVVSTLVSSGLSSPIGLAFDTSGNLYILNDSGNTIIKASTPANVTLSGTPTAAGTFNFTMTATDWAGATINKAYSVVISAGVSTIAPLVGPTTGGTTVAITGVGFSGATGVSFGNTALTLAAGPSPTIPGTYWVNSDSSISAVTPAAPAGPVNVVVTAGGAGSTLTLADQFTFELYFNYSWTTWSSLNWSTTAGSTVTWNSQTLPAAFSVSNGFYSWYAPSNTQTVNPLTGAISSTSPTSPYIWPGYSNSVPPQPITGSSLVTNIAGSAGMDGPFTNDPAGNNGSILSGDWKDFATGQLSYYGPYSNTTAWQNPVFWSYYNILVTGGQLPSNYTVTATTTTVTHSSGYQYFLTSDNTPNSPLGRTSYAGNSGMYYFNTDPSNTANAKYSNGPFFQDSRTKVTDISDGSSNTLLFGESLGGPDNALPTYQLSWMGSGTMPSYWDCQTPSQYFMFSSMHPGVVNFAFCDGSVRSITKVTASVPLDSMGALTGAPVTGDGTNTDSETAKPPAASNPPTARWIAFQLLAGISDNVSPDVTQLGLTP